MANRERDWKWVVAAATLAASTATVASCSSGGGGDGGTGDDGNCLSDMDYFQKKVSLPILEKQCMSCHSAQGQARNSKLVLHGPAENEYLRLNFEAVRDIASYEKDGVSILLLKPTATVRHGGGRVFEDGSAEYQAFRGLLDRFETPVVCDGSSSGPNVLEKVVLHDLASTLRHARLQLVGKLPADEDLLAAAGGDEAVRARIRTYLDDDAALDTLRLWFNELFLTDKYLRGNSALDLLDEDIYPNRFYFNALPEGPERDLANRYANDSVAREPLDLIAWVVKHDRPFSEILTARYRLVNPYSARVFGAKGLTFTDPTDPREFKEWTPDPAKGEVEGEVAGVLTSPMFLNRFPTTDTNLNRHRSRMVWKLFLATDVLKAGERPVDPTKIQDHNPTMNNPNCAVCHALVDPTAGAFQNWDARGRYRPPAMGWPESLRPPGFGDLQVPVELKGKSLEWLSAELVKDERFAQAAVRIVYQGLVGREPVENPTDESDPRYDAKLAFHNLEQEFLRATSTKFAEGGFKLKDIVADVVLSPFYRAQGQIYANETEMGALEPLGTAQILSPERLNQRLIAVLGYPWQWRAGDRNALLSPEEMLFFYGGIDSDQITRRFTEPNGIMANVGLRMAAQNGCRATPRDFYLPSAQRALFPYVETSYEPLDDNGFEVPKAVEAIKRNIQHMHQRVLGETLPIDHPEIEATYALFLETWKEGKKALAEREEDAGLNYQCGYHHDWWSDEELPDERRVTRDPNYVIRAWSAVLTYMLADFRFLYE